MIDNVFLGLAALVGLNEDPVVHEQSFRFPANTAFEVETDGHWNSLSFFSPTGEVLPEIEYLSAEGQWTGWHSEHFAPQIADGTVLEILHFPDSRKELLIRSKEETEVIGHFYNTIQEDEGLLVSSVNPFESEGAGLQLDEFSKNNGAPRAKFFSRSDWGADERLRWSTVAQKLFNRKNSGLPSEIDDFPTRFKPKITEDSYEGKALSWPVAEVPSVYKMVVHHTGEYVDPKKEVRRDSRAVLRSIYYYHTITLGWGDIGYHYVIDKQGNVFEGRRGGPKAIGAHVAYHNAGSIGVSLMGNFNVEEPTSAQLNSLTILLADHALRFKIDPEKRSFYLGQLSHNISGHRDVTAPGRGTACPGENLHNKLPWLRQQVTAYTKLLQEGDRYKNTTRNILQKSVAANSFNAKRFQRPEKKKSFTVQQDSAIKILRRNTKNNLQIEVTNNTDFTWPKGVVMDITNVPEGLEVTTFKSQSTLSPGEKGIFEARVKVNTVGNGKYALTVEPTFLKVKLNEVTYKKLVFPYNLQVSGDRNLLTKDFRSQTSNNTRKGISLSFLQTSNFQEKKSEPQEVYAKKKLEDPVVRIKLAEFDASYAVLSSSKPVRLYDGSKFVQEVPAYKEFRATAGSSDGKSFVTLQYEESKQRLSLLHLQTEGIIKIHSYDRGINKNVPFNAFRSDLVFRPIEGGSKLLAVNELPIEKYLYGLAEETGSEPEEKRKAILVLARSYAYVYSQTERRKFKSAWYDLEDSPATSQLYLGHDWERYHGTQKALVEQTEGIMLKYNDKPVIGPYFTQSAGASSANWQRQYPWTQAQELPFDRGLEAKGHGIGLSGNSARELAKRGKSYREIIGYFFRGTTVGKGY